MNFLNSSSIAPALYKNRCLHPLRKKVKKKKTEEPGPEKAALIPADDRRSLRSAERSASGILTNARHREWMGARGSGTVPRSVRRVARRGAMQRDAQLSARRRAAAVAAAAAAAAARTG